MARQMTVRRTIAINSTLIDNNLSKNVGSPPLSFEKSLQNYLYFISIIY